MSPETATATDHADAAEPTEAVATPDGTTADTPVDEVLVEEISIDGMCGVY